jgi:trigger factor
MKEVKQTEKTSTLTSKDRKLLRKKEIQRMQRNAKLSKIISICAIAVISIGLVSLIGYNVYRGITRIKPSSDYSAYLTEDGKIEGVNGTSHLKLVDYSNIKVPKSEVEYTDKAVEADIKKLLQEKATLNKETDALIEDGDKVNIDYVGSIDGVEFEGGNSNGKGSDLVIGSGNFIEGFEEQLIGAGVGDKVSVEVTFPKDYKNKEVAGKDAVFEVIINGIYVAELTDEYVKENLSDYASTAAEYREYLKQSKYEENLNTWLDNFFVEGTTVVSYPEKYTNHLKSLQKYQDQSQYEYMKQLYASMGYAGPATFEQYIDMSEAKYDASLEKISQELAKRTMIYQAIFEAEGLTITEDDYKSDDFDSRVEQYGKGFVMQQVIQSKVLEFVKEHITVE